MPDTLSDAAPHRMAVRVYFEDTDSGGVVYHATHLRWAERARTEWLRSLGLAHKEMIDRHGLVFVVRRVAIDYIRAAVLDEALVVETRLLRMGGASVTLDQRVVRQDGGGPGGQGDSPEMVAQLEVTLVCVRRDLSGATRIPGFVRSLVTGARASGGAEG